MLYHILDIYEKSLKAYRIAPMSYLYYDFETAKKNSHILENKAENSSILDTADTKNEFLFGNKENIGFLYYRPTTYHFNCCLVELKEYLPSDNFLISALVQKAEMPWVKLFPLRLFLRLGEEFNSKQIFPINFIFMINKC